MTSMRAMHLSRTQISGTLPWAWSTLTVLKELTMNDNPLLFGRLPETWSGMTELQVMDIHACNLTGPLPYSWGNMASLRHFNGSFNKFSGTIPDSWSSLAELSELALINNRLTGTYPTTPIYCVCCMQCRACPEGVRNSIGYRGHEEGI